MPDGNVITNAEALAEFTRDLERFNRLLETELRRMEKRYAQIGTVWRDDQYRQFGVALDEVTRGIKRYLEITPSHVNHLKKLRRHVESFLSERIR